MEFDYTIETNRTYEDALAAVRKNITEGGFMILGEHDLQEKFKAKGIDFEPYKIVEFCNAQIASYFLGLEIKVGLCLPCKINVYVKDGKTFISGVRPTMIGEIFPDVNFGEKLQETNTAIINIIDKSV